MPQNCVLHTWGEFCSPSLWSHSCGHVHQAPKLLVNIHLTLLMDCQFQLACEQPDLEPRVLTSPCFKG